MCCMKVCLHNISMQPVIHRLFIAVAIVIKLYCDTQVCTLCVFLCPFLHVVNICGIFGDILLNMYTACYLH